MLSGNKPDAKEFILCDYINFKNCKLICRKQINDCLWQKKQEGGITKEQDITLGGDSMLTIFIVLMLLWRLYLLSGKESACNAGDPALISGLGRSPWRREWLSTPVFLPGKFHGQKSLVGYSTWGWKKSDTIEGLSTAQALVDRVFKFSDHWNSFPLGKHNK